MSLTESRVLNGETNWFTARWTSEHNSLNLHHRLSEVEGDDDSWVIRGLSEPKLEALIRFLQEFKSQIYVNQAPIIK